MPRLILLVAIVASCWPTDVLAQSSRCDTARELMVNTRLRLQPDSSVTALQDASQNLRRATELCPGLGDAYYYLSLVSEFLKDRARAANWRSRAEFYSSQALRRSEPLFVEPGLADRAADRNQPAPAVISASPAVAPVRVSALVKRKYALVVGISRFQDARIKALNFTSRDAEAIARALKEDCEFDDVKVLLDEEATTYRLKSEIERIAKLADENDLVVIYMSSHGSPQDLDTAGINYIVTHDTEVSNLYPSAFRMDELLDAITLRIRAARVVAFLDTCYSGGTFKELPPGWSASARSVSIEGGVDTSRLQLGLSRGGRALVLETPQGPSTGRQPQGIGRVIVTSSSQLEQSWEDVSLKHGYFTYFLLEALRRPGLVSIDDVYIHLRTRVPEAVLKDKQQSQRPGIARSGPRVDLYLKDKIVGARHK